MERIDEILDQARESIRHAKDLNALENVRVHYLGKKGLLTEVLKTVGQLSAEEKPKVGQAVNQAKQTIQQLFNDRRDQLNQEIVQTKLSQEKIDVTLPGRKQNAGSLHPVILVRDRIVDLFLQMGFDVEDGPEVEDVYHNFEALNTPEHHPARAMQDTFYFEDGRLLRSHMSPVQIHYMQTQKPPIKMIAPGRVYRRDFDASHTPMFHQVEGLVVDKNVSFANLKSLLAEFIKQFFEEDLAIRFRPSYFPFTEPSGEVDMQCVLCHGKGCQVCGSGWLEILGCGMVHPHVLKAGNIDPEKYSGYAFGLGIDRLAMLYYRINDLRMLFENDIRFLKEF